MIITAKLAVEAGYEHDTDEIRDLIKWCTTVFFRWGITRWIDNRGGWVRKYMNRTALESLPISIKSAN